MCETLEISIKSPVNFYSLRFVDAVSKSVVDSRLNAFPARWQINFDIRFLFPSISIICLSTQVIQL